MCDPWFNFTAWFAPRLHELLLWSTGTIGTWYRALRFCKHHLKFNTPSDLTARWLGASCIISYEVHCRICLNYYYIFKTSRGIIKKKNKFNLIYYYCKKNLHYHPILYYQIIISVWFYNNYLKSHIYNKILLVDSVKYFYINSALKLI